jgi:hypothetical protein
MKRYGNLLFLLMLSVFLVESCTQEDTNPNEDGYKAPSILKDSSILTIPAGLKNNTTPAGLLINNYTGIVNTLGTYASALISIPPGAIQSQLKSTITSYTWTLNGQTLWLEYNDDGTEYSWNYYFKSSDMSSRKLTVKATESKSGAEGSIIVYDPSSTATGEIFHYTWTTVNGNINAVMLYTGGTEHYYLTYSFNLDGSGSFVAYHGIAVDATKKNIDVSWNSTGHGTYWTKDDSNVESSDTF